MSEISVVIRTKNEAEFLGKTLDMIKKQSILPFEVIVIDSGSTDSTLEIAQRHKTRILCIEPDEFTYGKALNLGIEKTKTKYVVSLSAHAVPVNEFWLENLLKPLLEYENCAGVYSRQVPHEDADPYTKYEMACDKIFCGESFRIQVEEAFFTNISSIIVRKFWEEVKFNETVPGSEDILWAKEQIKKGRIIIYNPLSAVYHSHEETINQMILRIKRETFLDLSTGMLRERKYGHSFKKNYTIKRFIVFFLGVLKPWALITVRQRIGIKWWLKGLKKFYAYYVASMES